MNVALFDHPQLRSQLLPFTYTRPVAEIRVGILTISEKWQHYLRHEPAFLTEDYLSTKYPGPQDRSSIYLVNGSVCPTEQLATAIKSLATDTALIKGGLLLAAHVGRFTDMVQVQMLKATEFQSELCIVKNSRDIFKQTGAQIRADYQLLANERQSAAVGDEHTIVYHANNIFIEEGVRIRAAILNAERGPIYLGAGSSVEEGAVIRGPFALGKNSTVNARAVMRGDISIGPYCKVGGEVSNSVLFAYSNKGHDGFLGNSVLGEWCNIGAGTNISNLKNNYTKIKVWDYAKEGFINTGEQFCGLMLGDHSKTGINTMLNTGTVVGVAANLFGAGFPRTFIPSFSWGGTAGFTTFQLPKVKEMAEASMSRREKQFNSTEEAIIQHVFGLTAKYRTWEK